MTAQNYADTITPKAKTLSGVQVIDETTLRITLTAPDSEFPYLLPYNPFAPMLWQSTVLLHSTRVSNVTFDGVGVDYTTLSIEN